MLRIYSQKSAAITQQGLRVTQVVNRSQITHMTSEQVILSSADWLDIKIDTETHQKQLSL